jgi:hypothetical protein
VLQDDEGRHLGFLLLAIKGASLEGDCVFMIMPKEPEMFDTPIAQPLFARKEAGEFRVTLNHDAGWSASIRGQELPDFDIQLDASGAGSWREADGYSGRALLPAAP